MRPGRRGCGTRTPMRCWRPAGGTRPESGSPEPPRWTTISPPTRWSGCSTSTAWSSTTSKTTSKRTWRTTTWTTRTGTRPTRPGTRPRRSGTRKPARPRTTRRPRARTRGSERRPARSRRVRPGHPRSGRCHLPRRPADTRGLGRGRPVAGGRYARRLRHQQRLPSPGRGGRAARVARRTGHRARGGHLGRGRRQAARYEPSGWQPGARRRRAEACVAVRGGVRWVATNTDRTLPSPRGPLPGNGALVAALATALGRGPDLVVGKPEPALFGQAAERTGSRRPLVVGDRLDTDIEGAHRAGMDSMLVLTGVARPADLLAAPQQRRPTYLADDLSGLFAVDSAPAPQTGGWQVNRHGVDRLVLSGDGTPLDALRVLCTAAWSQPATVSNVVADGPAAAAVLKALGLAG